MKIRPSTRGPELFQGKIGMVAIQRRCSYDHHDQYLELTDAFLSLDEDSWRVMELLGKSQELYWDGGGER